MKLPCQIKMMKFPEYSLDNFHLKFCYAFVPKPALASCPFPSRASSRRSNTKYETPPKNAIAAAATTPCHKYLGDCRNECDETINGTMASSASASRTSGRRLMRSLPVRTCRL